MATDAATDAGTGGGPQNPAEPAGIAVLGGSFNPPHRTHLRLAEQALQQLPVQRVLVMPSGDHPHKQHRKDLAPAAHRLAMARLAFAATPGVVVDDRELHRPGPSFTVDTLAELAREAPGRRLFFLIGSDNLPLLPSWHQHHRLLALATVVTWPRHGHPVRPEDLDELDLSDAERTALLDNVLDLPADDVSATAQRQRLAAAGDPTDVPPAVQTYIEEHGLYR